MPSLLADISNLLFPRHCLVCSTRLAVSEKSICANCITHLPRTDTTLGREHSTIEQHFYAQFPIERATSFFYYSGDAMRHLLHSLKYYEQPQVGYDLARIFASELMPSNFFSGIDIIIPMPIHWRRTLHRHYNQCEYIARGISSISGIPVVTNAIKRTVNNPSQTTLDHAQRTENVSNIFRLTRPKLITNKHVLLVDDVITTGSTITSCARTLQSAGHVRISILSLAYAQPTSIPSSPQSTIDILSHGMPLID